MRADTGWPLAAAGVEFIAVDLRADSISVNIDECRIQRPGLRTTAVVRLEPLVREPLTTSSTRSRWRRNSRRSSDPVRLRLLSSVASHAGGEACVCDISAGVEVSQPTVSHHLKVLRDAGLLTSERRASWVYYAVVPEVLASLSSLLSISADAGALAGARHDRHGCTYVTSEAPPVVAKLSTLDRFLPVWIGIAMAAGLLLGRWIPGLNTALDKVQIDGISLPIALGLLIMMYPVLAKVRYDRLDAVTGDRKLLLSSLQS